MHICCTGCFNVIFVCVFTDRSNANRNGKGVQEITDCRPISRKKLFNNGANTTWTSYPYGTVLKNIVANDVVGKTRFCIVCALNTSSSSSSSYYRRQQRNKYVLQLFMVRPADEPPAAVMVAFNVTGIPIADENPNGVSARVDEQDDGDYYIDPDGDELQEEDDVANGARGDYDSDNVNAVQRVIFAIDDRVDPGMYRGRICNGNGDTVSAFIKGMINVAAVPLSDDTDEGDYIIDDVEYDTGKIVL